MEKQITVDDYRALAEFRFEIRKFLIVSERIARSAGLRPQQYLMLLALRGLPPDMEPTIAVLADRLQIRHNGAVQLVNRLAKRGFVRRYRSKSDARKMLVRLTPAGETLIERLVRKRFGELVSRQPVLVKALNRIIALARSRSTMKNHRKT